MPVAAIRPAPESGLSAEQNQLIQSLSERHRARLLDMSEPVQLVFNEVLFDSGQPAQHVYFPTQGFVSLVARVDEHSSLEVGMVGREGMLGTPQVLGVKASPLRALVQGPGVAWRIALEPFRRELARSPALHRYLLLYVYVLMAQMVTSAGCLRFHPIGPRLARWLLMSQDRAQEGRFRVTHEFLSYMLGVRRVGVTVAAGQLQRQGLIHYHRGEMTVLNRPGLEAASCSCYAADRRVYAEQLM